MRKTHSVLLASVAWLGVSATSYAAPAVVTSIKPVHSLVAGVMEGVGTPEIIVDGAASPHTYSLRPSQAQSLEKADLVFWIGPRIETFLTNPLETIGQNATVVALGDAHGLTRLPLREGGAFEGHDHDHGDHDEHAGHDDHDKHADHDDHDHEKHADHDDHDDHDHEKHADHDDHDHEKHASHDDHDDHDHEKHADHDDHDDHDHEKHAGHDDHAHGEFDMHVWLDPQNAKALVHEIEEALAKADPENAEKYEANAARLEARLDELTTEVSAVLEPVKDRSFIVFHDAYPYFENRFGVSAAGSVTVSPEVAPGAARVSEIREKVQSLEVTCVFSEPQFEPKIVQVITENTNANSGVLDPLGATLENGGELYFKLIRTLADDMRACLSGNS